MAEADDQVDPYRVLQVDPGADHDVIQAAYRALARQYHPDVAPNAEAARRMAAINAAFDLIRHADRRAAYDRAHGHRGPAAPTAPIPPASPPAAPEGGAGAPRPEPGTRRGASWEGAAGSPPGRPVGSVLDFGRFRGWSMGEIARVDPGYLQWLEDRREGQRYRGEIDDLLRRMELRRSPAPETRRRRPFGRG